MKTRDFKYEKFLEKLEYKPPNAFAVIVLGCIAIFIGLVATALAFLTTTFVFLIINFINEAIKTFF